MIADSLYRICDYYSSPGGTSERLTLYCAVADLSQGGGYYGVEKEDEDIRFLVLPEDEVFHSLYDGQYNNAASLICLQWLQNNKSSVMFSGSESDSDTDSDNNTQT